MSAPDLSQSHQPDQQPLAAAAGLRVDSPVETAPQPATTPQEEWAEENFYRVILNLDAGDWVEVESFPDEASAEACASRIVADLAAGGAWPRVKSRFLRPETILSVEVSERRRYAGSAARASWGQTLATG